MQVKAETCGRAVILNCKGELTCDTLEVFSKEATRYLNESVTDLVINGAEMPFIDSAGLEYLLDMQTRLAEKLGQVTLTNLDESVMKILEITRLDGGFQICRDVAEAVKTL